MPREQINHPDLTRKTQMGALVQTVNDPIPEYGVWNDAALHVGWLGQQGSIGWIQVGLEVDQEYARFAMENPNGASPDRTVMWTPVMSPAEIDRLIVTLKRARRKAHKIPETV